MGTIRARALGLALVLGVFLYGGYQTTLAQAQTSDTATTTGSGAVDAYRTQLQNELDQLEAQIAAQQQILTQAKTQDVSLQRDIEILDAQIAQAQLSIKARNLVIEQLTSGIEDKQNTIFGLNSQLNGELDSLSAILREKYQLDTTSLVVAALSSETLSQFYSDLDTFDQINSQLQQSFLQISSTKTVTQQEQDDLQTQLEEETQLRQVQQLQEQQIQQQEDQKQQILTETKGQEKAYQTLIAQNQKSAAQIQAALFQLNGSAAIPFGRALDYANEAQKATGIRPAFLLGIIAEESDLGENLGTGSWQVDMSPANAPIFQAITASLGLNPNTMPVSAKPWYGWGGAMGPAQFIPSTWALFAGYVKPDYHYNSAKDRIGKLTGNTPPDPWNPEDAFMAAALYLTDDGAGAQTTSAEFRAAMCYLAGCGNVNDKSLQFYGQEVASLAQKYQCQIDIINGNPNSADCN